MQEIQEKQQLLRDRILYKAFDYDEFSNHLQGKKGLNLDNYSYDELNNLIDEFISETRNPKQQLLQTEIANKKYDISQFLTFMRGLRLDGDDIDNWSIIELKEAVYTFRLYHREQLLEIDNDNVEEMKENDEARFDLLKRSMIKPNNKNTINSGSMVNLDLDSSDNLETSNIKAYPYLNQSYLEPIQEDDEDSKDFSLIKKEDQSNQKIVDDAKNTKKEYFHLDHKGQGINIEKMQTVMRCDKEKSHLPVNNQLKIQVTSWQRVQSGWFSKVINYEIQTKPYEWKVNRKLSDFVEFRDLLIKFFPAIVLPPLESNHSESTEQEVNQRIHFINQFCNHLKCTEEIWSNEITICFFSQPSAWEQLAKQKKQAKTCELSKSSMSGFLQSRLCEENTTFNQYCYNYLQFAESQFQTLQKYSSEIVHDFKNISDKLSKLNQFQLDLSGSLSSFSKFLQRKLPKSEEIKEVAKNQDLLLKSYKDMSNILQSWSKYANQQQQLTINLKNVFKYQRMNIQETKNLFKSLEKSEISYVNYKYYLEKKSKDHPQFQYQKNVIQEEKMLKLNFGYWSETTYNECQKLLANQTNDYISFFNYFARYQTLSINEKLKSWGKSIVPYFQNPFPQPKPMEVDLEKSMIRNFK